MYIPLELIFRKSKHYLYSLVNENKNEIPVSSLKVLNQPLIVRNVSIASRILNIHRIKIPSKYNTALKLIQDNFPAINVEEYDEDNNNDYRNNNSKLIDTSTSARSYNISIKENMDYLEIPLNSALWYLQSEKENILINPIVYPWDFHYIIQKILQDELTQASISPNTSISKSTIVDGPCIIEDGVTIDDFCKIKGPTYIGRGSFIGMGSLVRKSMIGEGTTIGFNCEIGKSYFAGNNDKLAHHNVILDSIIGKNVWFGGYSGTANALLNKQRIRYEIDGTLVDTGTDHFGAVVGNNCAIGASVIILPGRQVASNSIVQAGTIFGKKQ